MPTKGEHLTDEMREKIWDEYRKDPFAGLNTIAKNLRHHWLTVRRVLTSDEKRRAEIDVHRERERGRYYQSASAFFVQMALTKAKEASFRDLTIGAGIMADKAHAILNPAKAAVHIETHSHQSLGLQIANMTEEQLNEHIASAQGDVVGLEEELRAEAARLQNETDVPEEGADTEEGEA